MVIKSSENSKGNGSPIMLTNIGPIGFEYLTTHHWQLENPKYLENWFKKKYPFIGQTNHWTRQNHIARYL